MARTSTLAHACQLIEGKRTTASHPAEPSRSGVLKLRKWGDPPHPLIARVPEILRRKRGFRPKRERSVCRSKVRQPKRVQDRYDAPSIKAGSPGAKPISTGKHHNLTA